MIDRPTPATLRRHLRHGPGPGRTTPRAKIGGNPPAAPPESGVHGPHTGPRKDWSQPPLPPPPLVRDSAVTRVTAAATGNSHGCAVLLQRALSPLRGVLQVGARSGTET